MEDNYIPRWITEGPLDYEYRYYTLLAEVEDLKSNLKKGELSTTHKIVDQTLDYIYKYDAGQVFPLEKAISSQFIGMDLSEFEYRTTEESITDELIDNAIELFEELYAEIREIWRYVMSGIKIEYVPSRKYFLNAGFVFVITADNKLHSYYFNKPSKYQIDWRSFKLKHIDTIKYTRDDYLKQLKHIDAVETDKIIFKVNCNNATRMDGFAIDIIKSMVYDTLKKDYIMNKNDI
jgi:hypothetical protein